MFHVFLLWAKNLNIDDRIKPTLWILFKLRHTLECPLLEERVYFSFYMTIDWLLLSLFRSAVWNRYYPTVWKEDTIFQRASD